MKFLCLVLVIENVSQSKVKEREKDGIKTGMDLP